jgi:hypothetical protein
VGVTEEAQRPRNWCRVSKLFGHAQGLVPSADGVNVSPGVSEHRNEILGDHASDPGSVDPPVSGRVLLHRAERLGEQGLGTSHIASEAVNGA